MPCFETTRCSVDLNVAMRNRAELEDAIRALGYEPMWTGGTLMLVADGTQVTISGGRLIANNTADQARVDALGVSINKAYAKQIVRKKVGNDWEIKEKSKNKWTLTKKVKARTRY